MTQRIIDSKRRQIIGEQLGKTKKKIKKPHRTRFVEN